MKDKKLREEFEIYTSYYWDFYKYAHKNFYLQSEMLAIQSREITKLKKQLNALIYNEKNEM